MVNIWACSWILLWNCFIAIQHFYFARGFGVLGFWGFCFVRFIHSHNRAHLNYTLEVNHLSDVLDEEFEMLKGQPSPDTPELKKELNEIPQLRINIPKTLPKNLDWRDYGKYQLIWIFDISSNLNSKFYIHKALTILMFYTLRELIFAVCSFEIFCGNLILRISHLKEN